MARPLLGSPSMDVDRARVVAIIRSIQTAILADRTAGSDCDALPEPSELVESACAEHGLRVEQWSAALRADAELLRLFDLALTEIIGDAPDPGPYDTISRESPRGAPDPLPEAFKRDARLLGQARR